MNASKVGAVAALAASIALAGAAHARGGLVYDPTPSDFHVPAPAEMSLQTKALGAAQATFQINFLPGGSTSMFGDHCVSWTPQAQAAFQYAANIWGSQLQSPVPIVVDACYADQLGTGILGEAGPVTFMRGFANAPDASTWYPIALANALAGSDMRAGQADIQAVFSSTFNWYYGTDGKVPFGQMDFVSVVLHELGHGLGFIGSMDVTAGLGSWGSSGMPFRYDRFTENSAAQVLVSTYPSSSSAPLAAALQSNAVYFNGANAKAGNGGLRAPLFAPATWLDGSSYGHLAESFNNTKNALMTYSLSSGESIHDPGPVVLGAMRDMGWTLQSSSSADVTVSQAVSANSASTGKDVVFTMTVSNTGPGSATGVSLRATYAAGATVVWASPACTAGSGTYTCAVGTLGNGATAQYQLVLRRNTTGTLSNAITVTSATSDPNAANNSTTNAVSVNASAAGVPVPRYRLYSPISLEHHFTTDLNEYNVLGASGNWNQEGTVGKVLNNPGSFNGVAAVPYYRLYNTTTRWHHWTTDPNEYYTLTMYPGWNGEGVDGYVLPSNTSGAEQLYRLVYPNGTGLHHWTVDAAEYNALIATYGWVGEGGAGFVIQ